MAYELIKTNFSWIPWGIFRVLTRDIKIPCNIPHHIFLKEINWCFVIFHSWSFKENSNVFWYWIGSFVFFQFQKRLFKGHFPPCVVFHTASWKEIRKMDCFGEETRWRLKWYWAPSWFMPSIGEKWNGEDGRIDLPSHSSKHVAFHCLMTLGLHGGITHFYCAIPTQRISVGSRCLE